MKTRNCDFSERVLARAVQLALLGMFAAVPVLAAAQGSGAAAGSAQGQDAKAAQARADEAAEESGEGDVKDLVCPKNFVDLGLLNVPRTTPKFGEYNGLGNSGVHGIGNFNVKGGNSYCQEGGTLRWNVYGTDVFTTSRNLGATASDQGRWSLGINFDELRHYTTTGYTTPYQGGGSGTLSLPSNFGVVNTGVNGGTRALTPDQLASFTGNNVYSERQNTTVNAGYIINNQWDVKFNFKHIDRSGSKLIAGATDPYNMTSLGGLSFSGQGLALKMNPTSDRTEQVSLALNWVGAKAYSTLEYYGSWYHDDYRGLSFANPFVTGAPATGDLPPGGFPTNAMSLPPSNLLNQLSFTGGYLFSPKTKLTGGLSMALNTQNSSYDGTYTATPNTAPGLPSSSLHGRVVNTHADARLTHQFSSALNLNAGFRFDERKNNTPIAQYSFISIGGGNAATATNAPESYRRTVFDATLNYNLNSSQRLRLGYKYDHMQRWCSNAIDNYGMACAQVPRSTDDSITAGYKLALSDTVNFNADYTYADRDATLNSAFYNPMQANSGGYENYGWLAFFQAPRREHMLKLRTDWQATDKLDVGLSGSYTFDNYYDSALGVQTGHAGSVNLDASYQVSDKASFGAYVTWQQRSLDMLAGSGRSAAAPPTALWGNGLTDNDFAIGLTGKQKFLNDKFQLTEDLSYNLGRSGYNTTLVQNIAAATGNSGQTPNVKSKIIQFRLAGSYQLSKNSRLNLGYMFQRVMSNDYSYNGYGYGFTPSSLLPSGLTSPSYTINVVYVLYHYTF